MVILLLVEDFTLMARVVVSINKTTNVLESVKVAPNVSTMGLVDFLIDVWVGVAWRLPEVDNLVASRHPLEIWATSLEMAATRMVRARPP